MLLSSVSFEGGEMAVVSPQTLKARDEVSQILVRHAVGQLSMAEAEHALWRVINHLTDRYDEGYNHGYRAAEESHALIDQKKKEPPYPSVGGA